MKRLRKVVAVATFEFVSTVRRGGYLIATFGMPVFMAAYGAIIGATAYYAEGQERAPAVYGLVDSAGALRLSRELSAPGMRVPEHLRQTLEAAGHGPVLDSAIAAANIVFRPFAGEEEARRALAERRIRGFFVLPRDYMSEGRVDAYSPDAFSLSSANAREALSAVVRQRLVEEVASGAAAARIVAPVGPVRPFVVTRAGEIRDGGVAASAVRFAAPLVFMALFLLSVLMTSGYLMQGTAAEKENKVVEVLLASANPDEILAGKLLGLGAAGLLQVGVWLAMLVVTGFGVVPLVISSRLDFPWLAAGLALPFFVLAFLFFGGLILGTGSLGSNMREAQQLAMVWSLLAATPLMFAAILVREPNGTLAQVLTWVPFTAGPIVVLRASTDPGSLAWWEIAGSLAVLVAGTWIALRIGGRLFRVGLLSAGTRPSLREVIRQARLAD